MLNDLHLNLDVGCRIVQNDLYWTKKDEMAEFSPLLRSECCHTSYTSTGSVLSVEGTVPRAAPARSQQQGCSLCGALCAERAGANCLGQLEVRALQRELIVSC